LQQDIDIKEEIEKSYLDYALSVIVGRTIPNVRDGLKPVHRRILFTMKELGNRYNQPFKKSARIVGDCIGKYHPHGDSAIYDALVRMAQDFNMRATLVDGQGNIGSIDGDKAAAMRYTECRMTKMANEFLKDLNEKTVKFRPNYDNSLFEPEILPTRIPNLFLNGTSGIAVGMATSIPPHNLEELINGTIKVIDNPEVSIEELYKIIKGPDFPTGGIIYENLLEAYKTGRGGVKIRGIVSTEKDIKGLKSIVIKEIPYMITKTNLLKRISKFLIEKNITDVLDLRDESNRNGIRIVLDLKRNSSEKSIIESLYKSTPLETTFSINILCVVNNKPKQINLKDYLELFIDHRREIVLERSKFEVDNLKKRAHILEGIKIALKKSDLLFKKIKESKNSKEATEIIKTTFKLSDTQVKAILALTFHKLTNMERNKVEDEYVTSLKEIKRLNKIITEETVLDNIVKDELLEVRKEYPSPRKTRILEGDIAEISEEELINEDNLITSLTSKGYIKSTPISEYPVQKRGGKGIIQGSDIIRLVITTNPKQEIMAFTNKGRYFIINMDDIPVIGRKAKGKHISNIIEVEKDCSHPFEKEKEFVNSMIKYDFSEHTRKKHLLFITKNGIVKKSPFSLFRTKRITQGMAAITLKGNDELLKVLEIESNDNLMFVSKNAMGLVINENVIRPSKTTRDAIGVIGMGLKKKDVLIDCFKVYYEDDFKIITICKNGYGRRTDMTEFKSVNRGALGLSILKVKNTQMEIAGAAGIRNNENALILTTKNSAISIKSKDVPIHKRYSLGGKIVKLQNDEFVSLIETTN